MFDIGWSEMVVVLMVAILVVGPKDLPRAIATMTKYLRKARAMAREFQAGLNDLAREAELEDLKKKVAETENSIKKQVEDAVDPTGSMQGMFDDIKPEIRDTGETAALPAAPEAKPAAPSEAVQTASDAANEAEATETSASARSGSSAP